MTPDVSADARRRARDEILSSARSSRRGACYLFLASFAFYLGVGLWLNLRYGYIAYDSQARVANASYVIFSRYPHFAAIGFVWNPLPSVVELPLVLARDIWQPMLSRSIAGVVMSSVFMAGAVVVIRGILVDRGVSRGWRWGLVAAFALHPMIVLYGANGMSEAPYIFFTAWAVRRLMRWLRSDCVSDLVIAGVAIGLDYMTRYEALAVGAGAGALVLTVAWARINDSDGRPSHEYAFLDAGIVLLPLVVSFVVWTGSSWLITGSPLLQFSSVYGNSEQVKESSSFIAQSSRAAGGALAFVVRNALALEFLLPVVAAVAIGVAFRRRDLDVLAPLVLFGAALGFSALLYVMGDTLPWLRFSIMGIPLAVVLSATLVPLQRHEVAASKPQKTTTRPAHARHRRALSLPPMLHRPERIHHPSFKTTSRSPAGLRALVWFARPKILALTGCLALLLAIPIAWRAMLDPRIGLQEEFLNAVVHPRTDPPSLDPTLTAFGPSEALARRLDSMRLPRGSVLIDIFQGNPVFVRSDDPYQFVLDSDYDFLRDLDDPARYGIRYIVEYPPQEGNNLGQSYAVNRRYPSMWTNGAGIATLAFSEGQGAGTIRVYRVDPQSAQTISGN
jgi:hypothetical protein